jgi:ferritin-like metal-binding protein YciE
MKSEGFDQLYVECLRDLYSAERQLIEALPKVAKAASVDELANAVQEHLRETQQQLQRLQQIFDDLEEDPEGKECAAMKGLIEEADEIIEEEEEGPVRDAGLIGAAQKVEHYEIAGYGTARTFARRLGRDHDAELLQQTLDEESATDIKLTELAEGLVNEMAAEEGSDESDTRETAGQRSN